jgi:hypothetical protein
MCFSPFVSEVDRGDDGVIPQAPDESVTGPENLQAEQIRKR